MKRRTVLSLSGAALAGLAGCLGGPSSPAEPTDGSSAGPTNDDDLPSDGAPNDGYPPPFDAQPAARTVDPSSFETVSVDPETYEMGEEGGVAVPLAPIDAVYAWYARREARFVDARSRTAYARSHIFGAVSSPAPEGGDGDAPVADWPKNDRIVCYCGCPHHLSSMRAAALYANGYEEVYVIDEGFWAWHDRGYPMAGDEIDARPDVRVVDGRVGAGFAGHTAWAIHPGTGQREAAPIAADGTYRLALRFADVTDASVVVIRTPAYRVARPLGELTRGVVTG